MTQPEEFDKDIELAKLQVDATIWASFLSMRFAAGSAIIAGTLVAMLAYALAYPNVPVGLGELAMVAMSLVTGGILLWDAKRDDADKQKEWKNRFKEISKRVKNEKAPKP
jgi:hypothetical protein